MHRLFFAIRPPHEIRANLLSIMGGIAGARWQNDAQLHLTLRFIGEVSRQSLLDIRSAASAVGQTPFSISLDGIGWFKRRERVDALWAGVSPRDEVTALHRKLDRALVKIGFEPEGRAFVPHITLARFGRHGGEVLGFSQAHGGLAGPAFAVAGFSLFESRLSAHGAHYEELETYPLHD